MKNTPRTPIPWQAQNGTMLNDEDEVMDVTHIVVRHRHIAEVGIGHPQTPPDVLAVDRANAAFIVTACNHFEALVQALEQALRLAGLQCQLSGRKIDTIERNAVARTMGDIERTGKDILNTIRKEQAA